ncbi:unnamed protein product, partial [Allacma fusca]
DSEDASESYENSDEDLIQRSKAAHNSTSTSGSSESETDEESSGDDESESESDDASGAFETTEANFRTEPSIPEIRISEEILGKNETNEVSIQPMQNYTQIDSLRLSGSANTDLIEKTEVPPNNFKSELDNPSAIFDGFDLHTEFKDISHSSDEKSTVTKIYENNYEAQNSDAKCPDGNCITEAIDFQKRQNSLDTTAGIHPDISANFEESIDSTTVVVNTEKADAVSYIDEDLDPSISSIKQKKESDLSSELVPELEPPHYTAFSDEQTRPQEKYSPASVVLQRYEIPDLSEKLARDLCRTVKISKIRSSETFLWTVLKTPVGNLKRSFSLVRPRFFPGCYKWRYSYCTGTSYPPLPENCGYFSLVRSENDECGYVKSKTKSKPKTESQDCPCIWPCTPFFDPIQECHFTDAKTDPDAVPSSNAESEAFPTKPLYINHARAAQLCRFVSRTRMDRSFHISHIPIPINLNKEKSLANECVQWFWEPCNKDADITPTMTGKTCGSQSCFAFKRKDVEVVQRNDLKYNKLCDIWMKVVKTEDKCKKFKQSSLNTPEKPDNATISKFQDALKASGYGFENTTIIPGNFTIDEGTNVTDYNQESIEIVEDFDNLTDIFIGDPIYDAEADAGKSHKTEKRDDTENDESWLGQDETPEQIVEPDTETTTNPNFESFLTTTKQPEISQTKRKLPGNRRDSICKTPEGKSLPICKIMKQALGQDLYLGRPVLNRRVPTLEIIQCNWFAELAICTILPKGTQNTGRRKRFAYNLRGKYLARDFNGVRQTRGIWDLIRTSKSVKNRKNFRKKNNMKKRVGGPFEIKKRRDAQFYDVADIFEGTPTNENNFSEWDIQSKLLQQREVELDLNPEKLSDSNDPSENNIPEQDHKETQDPDESLGGEVQKPSPEGPVEDPVQPIPDEPIGVAGDPTGENPTNRVILDLPDQSGSLISEPIETPAPNIEVTPPVPVVTPGSNEITIDLRNRPADADPIPDAVEPPRILPRSEQTDRIKAEMQKGIGIPYAMPSLNLVCDESGECDFEPVPGKEESTSDDLGYNSGDMIAVPHQCGLYGCFPTNIETFSQVKSRVDKEPAIHPDKGGYVQCSYSSGKPECKFTYITTHKHKSET